MKKYLPWIVCACIVLVASFWSIRSLFSASYFPMHDDTQVGRVVAMGRALRFGQFPVRWVSDLGYGYGYPIFNYYAPLPYYAGGFLYALGVPALAATKVMFGLGVVLSALSMYVVVSMTMGMGAGVIAAILYTYTPYHAVEIFVRGAVGEYWTLIFLPLIFLGVKLVTQEKKKKQGILVGGIGIAGVLLSHNIIGYVSLLAFAVFVIGLSIGKYLTKSKRTVVWDLIWLMVIGLGVSAFFWMPAILEMPYTTVAGQIGGSAHYGDHFVCLWQLWHSEWGFGGSAPGCSSDGMSFMLGKLHILLAVLGVGVWLLRKKQYTQSAHWVVKAGIVISVAGIFFTQQISNVFWSVFPLSGFVQYPWRLLVFVGFGMSLLGASLMLPFRRTIRIGIFVVLVIAPLLYYPKWFAGQYSYAKTSLAFEEKEELRWRVSKISDEYLPADFVRPAAITDIVHDKISSSDRLQVAAITVTDTYSRFRLKAKGTQELRVAQAYFPGLEYWVDGKRVIPRIERSIAFVAIPDGESTLELRFTNTITRAIANWVSVITILGLLYFYGKKDKKTFT